MGGGPQPRRATRRADLHHIQHWINGGRTDLANLISLYPYHHRLVHDRGYITAAAIIPALCGERFDLDRVS